jgi:hypothetical protein
VRPRRKFNYGSWWGRLRAQVFFRKDIQRFRERLEERERAVAEGRVFCTECGKRIEVGEPYGISENPTHGRRVFCSRCAGREGPPAEDRDS